MRNYAKALLLICAILTAFFRGFADIDTESDDEQSSYYEGVLRAPCLGSEEMDPVLLQELENDLLDLGAPAEPPQVDEDRNAVEGNLRAQETPCHETALEHQQVTGLKQEQTFFLLLVWVQSLL